MLFGSSVSHVLYLVGAGLFAVAVWTIRLRRGRRARREDVDTLGPQPPGIPTGLLEGICVVAVAGIAFGAVVLGFDVYSAGLIGIPVAVVVISGLDALVRRRKLRN